MADSNSNRSNGKAEKKHPGRNGHGSKRHPLSAMDKIRMGKGLYVRYERMNAEGVRTMQKKSSRGISNS